MPIPTDTFWNMKRLNWAFALSAVLLTAITFWSVFQDWGRDWRTPQRAGRVWQAAITDEKIERDLTPQKQAEIARLDQQIAAAKADLDKRKDSIDKLTANIHRIESEKATIEFPLATLKANVTVD